MKKRSLRKIDWVDIKLDLITNHPGLMLDWYDYLYEHCYIKNCNCTFKRCRTTDFKGCYKRICMNFIRKCTGLTSKDFWFTQYDITLDGKERCTRVL